MQREGEGPAACRDSNRDENVIRERGGQGDGVIEIINVDRSGGATVATDPD